MQLETLALVGDEDHLAGEFVARGTHDGTLPMPTGEVPPTGRKLEVRFTWFGEVADGKVTGLRDFYDSMALMMQLGLMPEAETAS
jgi:predicted ester cyclase